MLRSTLAGLRVAVTRSADRAHQLVDLVCAAGADVVSVPVFGVVLRPPDPALATAINGLTPSDLVAVTSVNGVRALSTLDVTLPCGLVAVGGATADAARSAGFQVRLVPAKQTAAALAEAVGPGNGRVVFMAAAAAGPDLQAGLETLGWRVDRHDVYDTRLLTPDQRSMVAANRCDLVAFTSGSTARGWVEAGGARLPAVSIGPKTSAVARHLGFRIEAEAVSHDLEGLIEALVVAAERSVPPSI